MSPRAHPGPEDGPTPSSGWTRRGLLAAAALGGTALGGTGLAACTTRLGGGDAAGTAAAGPATATVTEQVPGPTQTVTTAPTTAPPPPLPERPPGYVVLPGEVMPEIKQAAVDAVTAVLSFDDAGRSEAGLAERLGPTGTDVATALPLLGLLPESGPSAFSVSYPQYGGLNAAQDRASIMLVGEQLLLDTTGALVRRPVGLDVRLSRDADRWRVTDLLPGLPEPQLPPLSPAVQALLADQRVELTGLAPADLRSGVVQDAVAVGLLRLADRWRMRVHVFYSGHPVNVFATTRSSAHTVGRAVDVVALDGIPVIDQARAPWQAFMEAALVAGATDIGGPRELEPTERYFTDLVHQDHVHLGFPPVLPPSG